jgi:hypothetical protein
MFKSKQRSVIDELNSKIRELEIIIDNQIKVIDAQIEKFTKFTTTQKTILETEMVHMSTEFCNFNEEIKTIKQATKTIGDELADYHKTIINIEHTFSLIDKYLLATCVMHDYVNEYHVIATSLPERVYINVCGEKILVTKSDGMKSPVIAQVMSTDHKTLDIIDPDSFREVLLIIRDSILAREKQYNQKYNECMIQKMGLLKIDPNINGILRVSLYDKITKKILNPNMIYVITDDKYDIIKLTNKIYVENLENKYVFLRCNLKVETIIPCQEYFYFPALVNEQDKYKHKYDKYIGCACGDGTIHIHHIINDFTKSAAEFPSVTWRLWRKIIVTTKI